MGEKPIQVFGEGKTLENARHDLERSVVGTQRAHALGDIVSEAYQVTGRRDGVTQVVSAPSYESALDTLREEFGNDAVEAAHVLITREYTLAGAPAHTGSGGGAAPKYDGRSLTDRF